MTQLVNRNRSNKELVILMNMKLAMFEASTIDIVSEPDDRYEAVEDMLDKELAPLIVALTEHEVDLLYKRIVKGDELVYIPEKHDFTLSSLLH